MKVTCTSIGSFNSISVGAEYDVIEENEWSYIIPNDRGIRARYAKKYFNKVEEEPPKPKEPEFNPKNISITVDDDDDTYNIIVNIDNKIKVKFIKSTVTGNCGIMFLYGINDLFSQVSDTLGSMNLGNKSHETIKNALNRILQSLENDYGIVCFSSTHDFEDFWPIMNSLNYQYTETENNIENPNSENYIKMWCYYVYVNQDEE